MKTSFYRQQFREGWGNMLARTKKGNMDIKEIIKSYNLFILLIIFVVVASILSPSFFTLQNIMNLWQRSSIVGIVAIGMTLVALVGGIDLSVGSVAALSGMLCALALKAGYPIPLAIVLAILPGGVLGLIAGSVVTRFGLPDFISTLAVMTSVRGLDLLLTNGSPVFGLSQEFKVLGQGSVMGLPISGIIWLSLTIVIALLLKYTSFGRGLYAIGGNKEAALLSGIKVKKNYTMVYVICGLLSAFAGVILASWLSVAQPNEGVGMELNAIAATVLGGTSLAGGTGGVVGTFGGVFLMAIITNIFNLIGLPSYYQSIFMGVIIVLALLLNKVLIVRER